MAKAYYQISEYKVSINLCFKGISLLQHQNSLLAINPKFSIDLQEKVKKEILGIIKTTGICFLQIYQSLLEVEYYIYTDECIRIINLIINCGYLNRTRFQYDMASYIESHNNILKEDTEAIIMFDEVVVGNHFMEQFTPKNWFKEFIRNRRKDDLRAGKSYKYFTNTPRRATADFIAKKEKEEVLTEGNIERTKILNKEYQKLRKKIALDLATKKAVQQQLSTVNSERLLKDDGSTTHECVKKTVHFLTDITEITFDEKEKEGSNHTTSNQENPLLITNVLTEFTKNSCCDHNTKKSYMDENNNRYSNLKIGSKFKRQINRHFNFDNQQGFYLELAKKGISATDYKNYRRASYTTREKFEIINDNNSMNLTKRKFYRSFVSKSLDNKSDENKGHSNELNRQISILNQKRHNRTLKTQNSLSSINSKDTTRLFTQRQKPQNNEHSSNLKKNLKKPFNFDTEPSDLQTNDNTTEQSQIENSKTQECDIKNNFWLTDKLFIDNFLEFDRNDVKTTTAKYTERENNMKDEKIEDKNINFHKKVISIKLHQPKKTIEELSTFNNLCNITLCHSAIQGERLAGKISRIITESCDSQHRIVQKDDKKSSTGKRDEKLSIKSKKKNLNSEVASQRSKYSDRSISVPVPRRRSTADENSQFRKSFAFEKKLNRSASQGFKITNRCSKINIPVNKPKLFDILIKHKKVFKLKAVENVRKKMYKGDNNTKIMFEKRFEAQKIKAKKLDTRSLYNVTKEKISETMDKVKEKIDDADIISKRITLVGLENKSSTHLLENDAEFALRKKYNDMAKTIRDYNVKQLHDNLVQTYETNNELEAFHKKTKFF